MVDSTSMALARCGRRVNLSGMTISWPLPGFNAPAISMQVGGALGDAPEGGVALLEEMEEEKGWTARESKRGGWWKVSSAKSAGLKYFRMKTTMSNLARTVSRLNEHDLRADNGERCNRAWSVTKA
ncbi:hypothetical protein HZH66_012194 [Vespula vulgaris]|uniref:Uncharacterized protein n=2 Tax=Vespula TaxID=7451 RepID=A0A834JAP4_VESVU|nr:hypothetical protein HZH66_012194 [Vespula vulgaris]